MRADPPNQASKHLGLIVGQPHQSLGLALTIVCKPIANVGLNVRTTARECLERRKEGSGARGLSSRRQGLWTRVEAAEPPQAAITERKSIVAVDVASRLAASAS
jgi:hypothetical protein